MEEGETERGLKDQVLASGAGVELLPELLPSLAASEKKWPMFSGSRAVREFLEAIALV